MKQHNWILSLLLVAFLFWPAAGWSLEQGQLKPLATGGFGDSANSYSWGLTEFNGDIYVSTGRHHLYSMLTAIGSMAGMNIDPGQYIEAPPDPDSWARPLTGGATEAWADAHRAEIWRLNVSKGEWEKVLQSGTYYLDFENAIWNDLLPELPLFGYYPDAYAYRTLGTYEGYIYALGVGTWMPPIANSTILRSADGNTWEDVTDNLAQTTNVRSFTKWGDHVYIAVAVPGSGVSVGSGSVVYRNNANYDRSDPASKRWEQVSEVGFGDPRNEEIYYLQVFDGDLYASTVNYQNGFEVWKTDGTMVDGKFVWYPIIKDGFGDTWCQYGMHMEVFGDYLYVGTASGAGMVQKDGQPVGSRATDIIRIDKNDNAELVVGAYFPSDPPEGWPTERVPSSGLNAGFNNNMNVYSWHMGVYKDSLIVGTFDMTGMLLFILKEEIVENPEGVMEAIQGLVASSNSIPEGLLTALQKLDLTDPASAATAGFIIDYLIDQFGGGDLWQTKDGINWEPLTLSGLGNWHNYGFRRVVSVQLDGEDALFLGTSNPFTGVEGGGCEVWSDGPKSLLKRINTPNKPNKRK